MRYFKTIFFGILTTIVFATHSQEIIKLGNHRVINLNRGKVDTN